MSLSGLIVVSLSTSSRTEESAFGDKAWGKSNTNWHVHYWEGGATWTKTPQYIIIIKSQLFMCLLCAGWMLEDHPCVYCMCTCVYLCVCVRPYKKKITFKKILWKKQVVFRTHVWTNHVKKCVWTLFHRITFHHFQLRPGTEQDCYNEWDKTWSWWQGKERKRPG